MKSPSCAGRWAGHRQQDAAGKSPCRLPPNWWRCVAAGAERRADRQWNEAAIWHAPGAIGEVMPAPGQRNSACRLPTQRTRRAAALACQPFVDSGIDRQRSCCAYRAAARYYGNCGAWASSIGGYGVDRRENCVRRKTVHHFRFFEKCRSAGARVFSTSCSWVSAFSGQSGLPIHAAVGVAVKPRDAAIRQGEPARPECVDGGPSESGAVARKCAAP